MSKLRRTQCYLDRYAEEFCFVKKSQKGTSYAFCCLCNCDINIAHGGKTDIVSHAEIAKHVSAYNVSLKNTLKITDFVPTASDMQTIKAEVLFTGFLLEHNIPLAAADHVSKLLTEMFPNSPEVKKYASGRTKTGHLVQEIARHSSERVVNVLKSSQFSIATDGSSDNENQMYPLVVTFFDEEAGKINCTLFSLPILTADGTGKNIADLICAEFSNHNIPWKNCLSLSCDNANVMIGKKKGVAAYLKEQHSNLFIFCCLCHLINLAAEKGARTLPISFDDLLVDICKIKNDWTVLQSALR